jgi:acetyltransferase
MQSDYPVQYQKTSALKDGSEIFLRPIKPTDGTLMIELFNSLSKESVYLKFFSSLKYISEEQLEKITHIDYVKEMAIVALIKEGGEERMVAAGRYALIDDEPGYAEFAIVVQDAYQGRGLGTEVLWHLSHAAKLQGVEVIVGYIMNENSPMFGVLKKSGLTMKRKHWDRGVTRVDISIDDNILIQ